MGTISLCAGRITPMVSRASVSFAKRRLQKFNGVPARTLYLHLKESEYRFNNRDNNLARELLKLLERYPL